MSFKIKRIIITLAPPIAVITAFIFRRALLKLLFLSPPCMFHCVTGLSCPGCGNTRAVRALLSLDFISAVKYNITIPLLLVFALVLYAEAVVSLWIKPVKLVPRGIAFYITAIALMCVYFVARNLL